MSTISSGSISRARRLSPATRSRLRRHVSWPSRDGSERSRASTTKGDVSPRPHSRRRPSSGSTSSALMRSRRSAWRRTTSTSDRASPTWSVPSRSLSRPTHRSPRRSSTTSPSTRLLRATFDALTSSTPRRLRLGERYGDAASVRFVRGNRIFLDFFLGRWDRALESADTFIAECEAGSPHTLEYMAREVRSALWLARGDQDAALRDQLQSFEHAQTRHDPFHRLGSLAVTAALLRRARSGRRSARTRCAGAADHSRGRAAWRADAPRAVRGRARHR